MFSIILSPFDNTLLSLNHHVCKNLNYRARVCKDFCVLMLFINIRTVAVVPYHVDNKQIGVFKLEDNKCPR